MSKTFPSLLLEALDRAYRAGNLTPEQVVDEVHRRVEAARGQHAWIHVRSVEDLRTEARALAERRAAGALLPLYGVPFSVKDSIDVTGLPTTVACPALTRVATESSPVVQRLVDAGAIVIGKTNMDQLATGLVGVRSPYGTPENPFDARMIPGGSSSGSAVSVAAGHVSFSLATDTAGSGRVPAAFTNVVGLKPTRGVLSTRGVAPACRSIDCVTVIALTVDDACAVADLAKGWDELDPFSRPDADELSFSPAAFRGPWRLGVPRQREFFGDERARDVFDAALARFVGLGCSLVEVDFAPFREAGDLLYGGPWVVERLAIGGQLLAKNPAALLPVIREILSEARGYDAEEAFAAMYRLAELRQATQRTWRTADALIVPTTPTIYRVDEVLSRPRELNANLGIYTTFANLLDLAAVAVPAGFRTDGLPAGITVLGPARTDALLAAVASAYHRRLGGRLGATAHELPLSSRVAAPSDRLELAVVGAHLTGEPLNHQLVEAQARLVRSTRTAPSYRLFALRGTTPPKPGLVRSPVDGHAIDLEVWSLEAPAFARFVAKIPPPLCIGSIELEDRSYTQGFLCEPHALDGAEDISKWGGWKAYLSSRVAV
ncbi:MAG: allophanate hydrolase [Polyangiaceae bacterium]|jgi:allophanate hydrolase